MDKKIVIINTINKEEIQIIKDKMYIFVEITKQTIEVEIIIKKKIEQDNIDNHQNIVKTNFILINRREDSFNINITINMTNIGTVNK